MQCVFFIICYIKITLYTINFFTKNDTKPGDCGRFNHLKLHDETTAFREWRAPAEKKKKKEEVFI